MLAYFLPAILALGAITSYEDWRFGKIRNKWVLAALIYSISLNAILITLYSFQGILNTQYIIDFTTNLAISIAAGYALWHFNIWSAGDGKLFIAFAALIPLSSYSYGYQKWFPAISLLGNIFIPAAIGLGIYAFRRIRRKNLKKTVAVFASDFFDARNLLKSALSLFSIFWVIGILLANLGADNYAFRFAAMFLLYSFLEKKMGRWFIGILAVIAVARAVFDDGIYSGSFWISFIILLLVWRILFGFVNGTLLKLFGDILSEKVAVNDLERGMVLSEEIVAVKSVSEAESAALTKNKVEKVRYDGRIYMQTSLLPHGKKIIEATGEGLGRKDILLLEKAGFKKVRISATIPFAPFVFIGALLTIISNCAIPFLVPLN